ADPFGVLQELTWHPQIAPYMIIATDSNSTKSRIQWLDVRDGSIQRSWELPIKISGIGPGEGIPSNDGTKLALVSQIADSVVVVDMSRSGDAAVSAPFLLDSIPCGLCTTPDPCKVGNVDLNAGGHVSVSSEGTYLDV